MLATQVLPNEYLENESQKENNSDLVGFIVVENKQYEIKKGDNKIGRDPQVCSVVFDNNTVSKLHAVIESEGRDDTFIYDVGSTNPVRLGKKSLKPHFRYKLDDGSIITLGNIVAKFVFTPETSDACSETLLQTPVSQGDDSVKLPDDIFDIVTQVNVPQPSTSKVETFKLPNSFPSIRSKKLCHEISGNSFGVKANGLSTDETPKPVIYEPCTYEDSHIFSLNTQGQINNSPATIEDKSEKILEKTEERAISPEKVKSLLNDGQDDILCTFMLMHSPKTKNEPTSQEVVIKKEPITISEETFDAETQVEPQLMHENCVIKKEIELLTEDFQKNKTFVEEFFEQGQNDSLRNQFQTQKQAASRHFSANTSENGKFVFETGEKSGKGENLKEIHSQENYGEKFTQIRSEEEDLIQTQQFCMENFFKTAESQPKIPNPVSKNSSENSDTESCLEFIVEDSPEFDPKKTDFSDFTHPVKFMDFEEVKKNSPHLFQSGSKNFISDNSIKKELGLNDEKDVEHSREENNREDDTESFLEISFEEDLTEIYEAHDTVKRPNETENAREGNSADSKNSEKPVDSAKIKEENFDEDEDDDFEDFIATQEFDNIPVKNKTSKRDDDETQIFEAPPVQNLNSLPVKLSNVVCGIGSSDLLSEDEDFIQTQPFNEGVGNVKSSNLRDILSAGGRKDVETGRGQLVVQGSDDETEPYLKLEVGHDEKSNSKENPFGAVQKNISEFNENEGGNELDHDRSKSLLVEERDLSDSSYVFQLEEENQEKEVDIMTAETVKLDNDNESLKENKPPVCANSDSDATDCEEVDIIHSEMKAIPIKIEVLEKITQAETQVLTLTLPENFAERQYNENEDGWMRGKESTKFETVKESNNESENSWSQLSLEMPSTQDIETTLEKMLTNENEKVSERNEERIAKPSAHDETSSETKKTELKGSTLLQTFTKAKNLSKPEEGGSTRAFDSPAKRNRDRDSTLEVVPIKKSRTSVNVKVDIPSGSRGKLIGNSQKLLAKLWQSHDIAQIQPTRTRNSLKNVGTGDKRKKINTATDNKVNNETPNRRRSTRLGSASKRQKVDMVPNIHKKIEEAKKSFQSERRRGGSRQNERLSKSSEKPETNVIRVLRSTRRNSSNLMKLNNSFDYNGTSGSLRTSSRTINDKSWFSDSDVHVVFTGFDCESLGKVIHDLGGKKSNELSSASVVVADKVRRTVKFLCAIGLGLPITSPQWLWLSKKANKFLNPWNHLLKEEESEEKWDFDLKDSLERSRKRKLLEGYSVFATENTKPPVKDLLAIVECCGGIPLATHPEKWPKKAIVVSCLEDKNSWPSSKFRNVKIVHYEFILSGVLRQRIDFKTFKLR